MNDFDPNFDMPARMNEASQVMKHIPSIKALSYLQVGIALYLHARLTEKHDPTMEKVSPTMETFFRVAGIDIKKYL